MSEAVYAALGRIHSDYTTAIAAALRQVPDDALADLVAVVDAHNTDALTVSFKEVPTELYPLLPRLRPLLRREVARRIETSDEETG